MFSLTPQYFNDFFRQPRGQAEQAIRDLWQVRDSLLESKNPVIGKIYSCIEPLYRRLSQRPSGGSLSYFDTAMIGLFDASLAKEFMSNPDDDQVQDALIDRLIVLDAAIGSPVDPDAKPYDTNELILVLTGKADFFSPDDGALTFRRVAEGQNVETLLPYLMTLLTDAAEAPSGVWQAELTWSQVVVHSALLHTVWSLFVFLNDADQQFLINHFLYQSVVCGVPVTEYVRPVLDGGEAGPAVEANRLFSAADVSQELVPIKTDWKQFRALSILLHTARAAMVGEGSGALALDQFVRKIYQDQDGRDVYARWLRETITVSQHLKEIADQTIRR